MGLTPVTLMSVLGRLVALLYGVLALGAAETTHTPTATPSDHLAVVNGVTFVACDGQPESLGTQAGEVLADQVRGLLNGMATLIPRNSPRLTQLAQCIPPEYQHELDALAHAAHVDATVLTHANLVVDTMCSAVVHLPDEVLHRPLVMGRNLDFGHADLLGRSTVVSVMRSTGKHVVISIGWPGYTGVVSGMNDAGVSACILLNHAGGGASPNMGTPLCYRVRALLEDSANADEAIAAFSAAPIGSNNFVVITDSTKAAVVWQDGQAFKRVDPKSDWLFCTNGPQVAALGGPNDARGKWLRSLSADTTSGDALWMHAAMASVYLTDQNAQAMVFIPAERRLHLATGAAGRAAALSLWRQVDLAPLFAGGPISDAMVMELGHVTPVPQHYR